MAGSPQPLISCYSLLSFHSVILTPYWVKIELTKYAEFLDINTLIGYFQIVVLNQGKNEQDICDITSALRHAIDMSRD